MQERVGPLLAAMNAYMDAAAPPKDAGAHGFSHTITKSPTTGIRWVLVSGENERVARLDTDSGVLMVAHGIDRRSVTQYLESNGYAPLRPLNGWAPARMVGALVQVTQDRVFYVVCVGASLGAFRANLNWQQALMQGAGRGLPQRVGVYYPDTAEVTCVAPAWAAPVEGLLATHGLAVAGFLDCMPAHGYSQRSVDRLSWGAQVAATIKSLERATVDPTAEVEVPKAKPERSWKAKPPPRDGSRARRRLLARARVLIPEAVADALAGLFRSEDPWHAYWLKDSRRDWVLSVDQLEGLARTAQPLTVPPAALSAIQDAKKLSASTLR